MDSFVARFLAAAFLIGGLLTTSVALTHDYPDEDEQEPTSGEELPSESHDPPPHERETELLAKASEITDKVAEIRGLPQLQPIPKGVKDRDQLRAMLIERLQEDMGPEDFELQARIFRRLGLFEPGLDYQELMLDLLTEQIAGFYDQSSQELYIMEGLPASLQEPTMAHEIFHALQDQHFDIGRLLAPDQVTDNDDFTLARMALIEGDATVLMIDYELYGHGILPRGDDVSIADMPGLAAMLMELNTAEMSAVDQLADDDAIDLGGGDAVPSLTDSVLGSAPPIIRDALLFPYIEGMRFVLRARAGRSWEDFDAIYDDAPLTTSQIFNPESYFDGPEPLDIRFSAEAVMGDDAVYDNAFGELQVRSWLRTHHTDEASYDPDDAATGLRGDRIRAYPLNPEDDEAILVAHLSSWKSEDQARQFATALESTARYRHEVESHHSEGTHGEGWCLRLGDDAAGERLLIERWGDMVLYIEGAPSLLDGEGRETDATTFQVRESVWESHRRQPLREVLDHQEVDVDSPSPATSSAVSVIPFHCH